MTLRLRLLLPFSLLLIACWTSTAGAATLRPPSDSQVRMVAGAMIATGSAVIDVSSEYDLAQGTRTVVVEYCPEARMVSPGQPLTRANYDPANPMPIGGVVLVISRGGAGQLTYNITAVSESQPRFYIRGQIYQGRRSFEQVVGLQWQELTPDSPEITDWFSSLEYSPSMRVPGGSSLLSPALVEGLAVRALVKATMLAFRAEQHCIKIKKKGWIIGKLVGGACQKAAKILFGKVMKALGGDVAVRVLNMMNDCGNLVIPRVWKVVGGKGRPPKALFLFSTIVMGC